MSFRPLSSSKYNYRRSYLELQAEESKVGLLGKLEMTCQEGSVFTN